MLRLNGTSKSILLVSALILTSTLTTQYTYAFNKSKNTQLRQHAQEIIDTCLSFAQEATLTTQIDHHGVELFRQADKFGNTLMHYIAMLSPTCSLGQPLPQEELHGHDVPRHIPHLTGRQELFEFLQARHVNINAQNKKGQVPLHIAAINNSQEVIIMLLAAGANPNIPDNHHLLPLFYAIKHNHSGCAQELFNVSSRASIQATLHACPALDHHIVTLQRQIGAPFAKPWATMFDGTQRTLLHYAAEDPAMINAVNHLLAHGANPCAQNRVNETPFIVALMTNNEPAARAMLAYMPPLDSIFFNRLPLLHHFIAIKHLPAISLLLKLGANPHQHAHDGKSAILYAVETNKDTILTLFDYKQLLASDTYDERPTLAYLFQSHNPRSIALLTKLGFFDATTAMKNPQLLRNLLQCKAWKTLRIILGLDPQATQLQELDLLLHLISECDHKRIKALVNADFIDLVRMQKGKTILHHFAATNDDRPLQVLLGYGANPLALVDDEGETALHVAALLGHREAAVTLLGECPALINVAARNGKTPLHLAIEQHRKDLITIFTRGYHANICDKDLHGISPLILACLQEDLELCKLLCESTPHSAILSNELGLAGEALGHKVRHSRKNSSDQIPEATERFVQQFTEWQIKQQQESMRTLRQTLDRLAHLEAKLKQADPKG